MPLPLHPPPYRVDERSLEADTIIDIYTAGGPGGQHRNKTQNAVRLHHGPSGLIVSASERRSLDANLRAAFERLTERLDKLNQVPILRKPTRRSRGSIERRLGEKAHTKKTKALRRSTDD